MNLEPISLSMAERLQAKNMYLCVRVDGENPAGQACYAYFGIFLEDFLQMVCHLQKSDSMNPKDCRAIVLARSTGQPTPAIREFMRRKFSFADETQNQPVLLEISN
jgi:hypothetical protein